ncbi:anaerobic ribonucleoside-triphosphate reductase activating protein [Demequina iriomotensis]|uniref:anaerobic ribonucleoside-triphosphate reductase activating protein n=1 Tax=Demequina iriomotensis TaxID=1536641 RepID=UPI0014700B8D|nr:anaerobic ribonucleoside-triphosphate reductase activating protein [Demequina iriomotensis]
MSTTEIDLTALAAQDADALAIADFLSSCTHAWPGRIAATVTLQGCPWLCAYCGTPESHDPTGQGRVTWRQVVEQLSSHSDVVDAVVFGGGEPTRQDGLVSAIREARSLGYEIGLHTMGAHPGRVASVLPTVDWVRFDLKGTPGMYEHITGSDTAGFQAWASLEAIHESGVEYEILLTVDPTVHTRDNILATVREVIHRGFHAPVLQQPRRATASVGYRRALRGRGLYDVITHEDLPDLTRR